MHISIQYGNESFFYMIILSKWVKLQQRISQIIACRSLAGHYKFDSHEL